MKHELVKVLDFDYLDKKLCLVINLNSYPVLLEIMEYIEESLRETNYKVSEIIRNCDSFRKQLDGNWYRDINYIVRFNSLLVLEFSYDSPYNTHEIKDDTKIDSLLNYNKEIENLLLRQLNFPLNIE